MANTLYSTKDITSQGKGSLLDGGESVKLDTLTNTVTSTYGITGNQSDKLPSGYSVNIPAQPSAKVSAGQSAKFYAGLSSETLSYPNPDIPNRGEITPFEGFPVVTTRGKIEFCQSINDRRVEFSESIKKGSASATRFVQPFGSMPSRSNSFRPSVLSQFPSVMPASDAADSNCSFNSGVSRKLNIGERPAPFGLLSLLIVDMYRPIKLICSLIGLYHIMIGTKKTTPPKGITSTNRGLTTTDNETIEVAMSQYITPVTGRNSLTPSQSFRWLFLALERGNPAAKPHRIEATAPNEHSARLLLVRDYILSFAGRLPVREVAA